MLKNSAGMSGAQSSPCSQKFARRAIWYSRLVLLFRLRRGLSMSGDLAWGAPGRSRAMTGHHDDARER
jgi:hypothetical protein